MSETIRELDLSQCPPSYKENSPLESRLLAISDIFQCRYTDTYPDRRPLLLSPLNECGVRKFVSTTLRPRLLPYKELYNWEGCSSFIADHLVLEHLESSTCLPAYLFSPDFVLRNQKGTCFDFSTLLCSLLLGTGYDAYCVSGYADKEMCLLNLEKEECPLLITEADVTKQEEVRAALLKGQQDKLRFHRIRERHPSEPLLVHCWVLVLLGNRGVEETFFIDALTGKSYSTIDKRFIGVESVWNQHNYWVNIQDGSQNIIYNLEDLSLWEPLLYSSAEQKLKLNVPRKAEKASEEQHEEVQHKKERHEKEQHKKERHEKEQHKKEHDKEQHKKEHDKEQHKKEHEKEHEKVHHEKEQDEKKQHKEEEAQVGETDSPNANKVEVKAKHLKDFVMPASWVSKLRLSRQDLEKRYPGGQKVTQYRKAKLETFAPYMLTNGLITRLTTYKDLKCTRPSVVKEWFQHRHDHLEEKERNLRPSDKSITYERFTPGRSFCLKHHRYVTVTEQTTQEMEFYGHVRSDGLVRRVQLPGEMTEIYEDRDDFLYYRYVVPGLGNGPIKKVIDRFHRNRLIVASEDVAERVFQFLPCDGGVKVSIERIEVTYHLEDERIIPEFKNFIKLQEPKLIKSAYTYQMPLELQHEAAKVIQAIDDSETEAREILSARKKEEEDVKLIFSIYNEKIFKTRQRAIDPQEPDGGSGGVSGLFQDRLRERALLANRERMAAERNMEEEEAEDRLKDMAQEILAQRQEQTLTQERNMELLVTEDCQEQEQSQTGNPETLAQMENRLTSVQC